MDKSLQYSNVISFPLGMMSFFALGYHFSNNYNPCQLQDKAFDQLLIWSALGALMAMFLLLKLDSKKVNYIFLFIIRFVIGYSLFYSVYYHYWYEYIPDINIITLYDTAFKDIEPSDLKRLINKVSIGINKYEAAVSLISLLLLLNRRTSVLGFALLVPVYLFINSSNVDPACDMHKVKLIALLSIGGLLPELPNVFNFIFTDKAVRKDNHPFFAKSHLYNCLTLGKYYLLAGLFILFINKPNNYQKYYANNMDSPIKGVWTIKDVSLNKNTDRDYQTDSLFKANKIYLSSSRYGKIKMNDTLSTFEYMVDPSNHQFEMWNFYDYRKMDLKGKFETLSNDTIRFTGKNGKDTVTFTMVLEEGFPIE